MKVRLLAVCALVFFTVNFDVAFAKTIQESKAEADQYYDQQDFKNAYKHYSKLAKKGDHHSQAQLSRMLAQGEGRKIDLTDAYAWSVLAAESGKEEWLDRSDMLLGQVSSKPKAEEKAAKLMRNYGQAALEEKHKKAEKRAREGTGSCTGSRVACRSK